ncbi:hypothetical protein HPP92_027032 [Vanilla planifolia]|uniref:Uncharacterized protein n=1 Tax=Vanilla planifolia TaxID=51239 RepID=A0A835RDX6_VANPL|nr:hypothetical protein HPP92_027032 [Vanilla planifolia]KAG0488638.1 hypothetical protein HPP92_007449 [Vanilla planifolia]
MMLKKLQQKYARIKDEIAQWDELQSQLLSQFGNASSIIERLPVLSEDKNYGGLKFLPGIKEALLGKQMVTLERIFFDMKDTMKEIYGVVLSIDKIVQDAFQILRGSTPHQMHLHVGIKPSLQQCLDGLKAVQAMYKAEYLFKSSVVSSLTCKCSAGEIAALRQLLTDQPNISKMEVQTILK